MLGPAAISIVDLSSRVNVNTITSDHALQRFLNAVFADADANARSAAARNRANGFFRFRSAGAGGSDIRPGAGNIRASAGSVRASAGSAKSSVGNMRADVGSARSEAKGSTESLQPDLRVEPVPGTRRFDNLHELRQRSKVEPQLFTDAELEVLKNFITVFSQSPEVFNLPDGSSLPKMELAETTSGELLLALHRAFPEKDPRLLMQFAANLADYIDADDTPTTITDPSHAQVWNMIIGNEQVPLITEVYPDAAGEQGGDQGQFIELHNPWEKPITLTNWRIALGAPGAGATAAATGGVLLNTVIPAKGYLIITDNYDQPSQDSPAGAGSFLSIFGARKDDVARKVINDQGFDLPDKNSYVMLLDGTGSLIDVFSYTGTAAGNSKTSYQRNDPRVRAFGTGEATPFAHAGQGLYTGKPEDEKAMVESWKSGNGPLASPIDLLKISTSYAGLKSSGEKAILEPHAWQKPLITLKEQEDASNLDITLLDMFYVPQIFAKPEEKNELAMAAGGSHETEEGERIEYGRTNVPVETAEDATSTGLPYSYGKLNLNTCSKPALFAIDARHNEKDLITDELAEKIISYRDKQLAANQTPFLNTSDLVRIFFPDATEDEYPSIGQLLNQVTVSSSSFEIAAENHVPEKKGQDKQTGTRRPAASKMKWVVALDHKPYSLINFTSQP